MCKVVELGILTKSGAPQCLTLIVVPHICDPVCTQPISAAKQRYEHLSGLDLADSAEVDGRLEIDVLIGSDQYWGLVTGRVTKGATGPTAIETSLGWILSGPVEGVAQEEMVVSFVTAHSTHSLRVGAVSEEESLEVGLRRFWDLESLGILKDDKSVHESFTTDLHEGRKVRSTLALEGVSSSSPRQLQLVSQEISKAAPEAAAESRAPSGV